MEIKKISWNIQFLRMLARTVVTYFLTWTHPLSIQTLWPSFKKIGQKNVLCAPAYWEIEYFTIFSLFPFRLNSNFRYLHKLIGWTLWPNFISIGQQMKNFPIGPHCKIWWTTSIDVLCKNLHNSTMRVFKENFCFRIATISLVTWLSRVFGLWIIFCCPLFAW